MRNVPDPFRYRAMRARNSAGRSAGATKPWNSSEGLRLEATIPAATHCLASVDHHLPDRCIGPDLHALSGAGFGHGLGDGAHAADRVAPGTLLAVHLAEGVVQHHIGRSRAVGTSVVAHHSIEAEGCLDRLTVKPTIQETARTFGEQVQKVALAPQGQGRQPADLTQGPHQA